MMFQEYLLWLYNLNTRHDITLIMMCKAQCHQGKTRKTVEVLLKKSLYKFTTEPILVNREKFPKNPNFGTYFQDIK